MEKNRKKRYRYIQPNLFAVISENNTIFKPTILQFKKKSLALLTVSRQARPHIKAVIPKFNHVSHFLGNFVKIDTLEILIQEV